MGGSGLWQECLIKVLRIVLCGWCVARVEIAGDTGKAKTSGTRVDVV